MAVPPGSQGPTGPKPKFARPPGDVPAAQRLVQQPAPKPVSDRPEAPPLPSFQAGQVNQGLIRDAAVRYEGQRSTPVEAPRQSEVLAGRQAGVLANTLSEAGAQKADPNEIRPAPLLTSFESMKDVYQRIKKRLSPKTKELLDGTALEDLVRMLSLLHENEPLVRKAEARIKNSLYQQAAKDGSPLLTGFSDPRLTECWRLFTEGWDIWVPTEDDTGVELFLEGEFEGDDGEAVEALQSLALIKGDLILHTQLNQDVDTMTFDGEAFYRLKTPIVRGRD